MHEELVKRLKIAAQLADNGLYIPPSLCIAITEMLSFFAFSVGIAIDLIWSM